MNAPFCGDRDLLAQFAAGMLASDSNDEVEAHVAQCDVCLAVLQDLSTRLELLIRRLPSALRSTQCGIELSDESSPIAGFSGYQLGACIGEGGMGRIYWAFDGILQRPVAVKLIRPDLADSSSAKRRFFFEAQVTARLQHPGIPPVYQVGEFPNGTPFVAMKLIEGQTLQSKLRGRTDPGDQLGYYLSIFEQICHAVGFAHARGVIHRDLKPSNIMVGPFGEVQVMDWGLAKELGTPQAPETSDRLSSARVPEVTDAGAVVGTWAYMAPEQARAESCNVDARSDVFGLGAILCEILTGRPVYRATQREQIACQARSADLTDAWNRLDASGADGEWIELAKWCLSPSPDARPADASVVAQRVGYLRQQAEERLRLAELRRREVEWQVHEQIRRRQSWRILAVTLLVTTLLSSGLAWWVSQAERRAATRLAHLEQTTKILADVFRYADPGRAAVQEEPLSARMARGLLGAIQRIDTYAAVSPTTTAALEQQLGQALIGLGYAKDAITPLERAVALYQNTLGADHLDTWRVRYDLAEAYHHAGDLQRARQILEESRLFFERRLGTEDVAALRACNSLAAIALEMGQYDEACRAFGRVFEHLQRQKGDNHLDTLVAGNNLAEAYHSAGKLPDAQKLLSELRSRALAHLGANHPLTLSIENNLASIDYDENRINQALDLWQDVLERRRQTLGNQHPDTWTVMNNVAAVMCDLGMYGQAVPLLEETYRYRREKFGATHLETLTTANNLAMAYHSAGDGAQAMRVMEEVVVLSRIALGANHPCTLNWLRNWATMASVPTDGDLAERLWKEVTNAYEIDAHLPLAERARYLATAGWRLLEARRPAAAEPYLRRALEYRLTCEPDSWSTYNTMALLGTALAQLDRLAEAESYLVEGTRGLLQRRQEIPAEAAFFLKAAIENIASFYEAHNDEEMAVYWRHWNECDAP